MHNKKILNNLIKISEDSQCDCWICEAAFSAFEELTRALKEIDKLRAAGDALVNCLNQSRRRHPCNCLDGYDERISNMAIIDWQEACRG
jgi:hypothetical protein